MARMLGRSLERKFCNCWDCGGSVSKSRTRDSREGWEYEERAEGLFQVPEDSSLWEPPIIEEAIDYEWTWGGSG